MTPAAVVTPQVGTEAANSQPKPNDAFVDVSDFVFDDGETLASLKLHYLTLGTPRRDASGAIANGVLLLHGTAGSAADLAQAAFFEALYGAGEPLDLSRYFLVIPDAIGAGDSSKPSDGLRTHFPHYGYKDQVRAQHLLLEKIGITHLKLVLGTSMGGMQTWLWGEMFPNDMDCLTAIASTPAAISGKNMIWREMISQAIRSDPAWRNGDYSKDSPPRNWIKAAIPLSAIMTGSSEQLQKQAPTRQTAIDLVDKLEADGEEADVRLRGPGDHDRGARPSRRPRGSRRHPRTRDLHPLHDAVHHQPVPAARTRRSTRGDPGGIAKSRVHRSVL